MLGWLRCFENRTPADLNLECLVPAGVPTVFFAQTFCSKNILARHLARRHNGLYVDSDGTLSRSERAKIEAFLHSGKRGMSPPPMGLRPHSLSRPPFSQLLYCSSFLGGQPGPKSPGGAKLAHQW